VFLVRRDISERDLMGSPESFEVVSIDVSGSGPSLGRTQHNHGPSRSECLAGISSLLLVASDLGHTFFKGGGHGLVHGVEVGAFDKVGGPSVSDKEGLEFFVGDSGEDGWVVDLVAREKRGIRSIDRRRRK
jgi:hypothetical protein